MLTINIFFCLVLPTQLLRNVKASHQIDLAYLYYLPFCSVFTSKDNFHVEIVPLFMRDDQTFVSGIALKDDLKKLVERYSALDESELRLGMNHYAQSPPDDPTFLTTQLWDKHTPKWRDAPPPVQLSEQLQGALMEAIKKLDESESRSHDLSSVGELNYVKMEHKIRLRRGKWRRYSPEMEARILESEKDKS